MVWIYWTGTDSGSASTSATCETWTNWTDDGTGDTWTTWTSANMADTSLSNSVTVTCEPATNGTVWVRWNDGIHTQVDPPEETAEERREREAREERARIEAAEREKEREAAQERARQALIDHLTDKQLEVFERNHSVPVTAFKSGNKYLIEKGRSGNVRVLDKDGRTRERLCFHPRILCPDYDVMLMQKLMLESAEEEALRVANRHPA